MPDRNILMFGGTFDPIHNGHRIIARAAAEQLNADQIILIPAAQPPHKKHGALAPYPDRLAMARLAVEHEPALWRISDCEGGRPGPSYTLDTVRHLKKQYGPADNWYWLIGGDTVRELTSWYKISELADECTLAVALRPGCERLDFDALKSALSPRQIEMIKNHILTTPLIDISATDIRRRAAAGLPLTGLVPPAVENYIAGHGFYSRKS
jgi:nicotinate-nucleotide adenylyltransferase